MARWDHSHIHKVAAEKERYRGSDDLRNLLRLVTESIYSDDIHYALELIQNAEDEGATLLSFRVTSTHVIAYNDGEPFDERDVEAICSVETGFKRNKIGFFGIGFKSVFNITDAPQIVSGHHNFRIQDCLYPEPVGRTSRDLARSFPEPDRGALFILPVKQGKVARNLARELEAIDDRLLLFLTNIQRITFRDETSEEPREWTIAKVQRGDIATVENTLQGRETQWRVFSRTLRVPHDRPEVRVGPKKDAEQTRLVIAFPIPNDTAVPDLKSECLYCYLPTKRRPDMPFLMQGDFIPTLARENIDESSPWNLWLLEEIARLAADSYLALRHDSVFRDHLFDLIRLPDETGDALFRGVAAQILDHLSSAAMAPINVKADRWCKPSAGAIVPDELRQLVKPCDLEAIYGNRRQHVDSGLSDRGREVLAYLGVPEVELPDVINLLSHTEAINSKSAAWFLDIYDYLARQHDLRRLRDTESEFKRLGSVPFLRTSDGQLVAPADYSGSDRLLVQHPRTKSLGGWVRMFDEGELVFLDQYFQEAKKDRRAKIDPELEERRKRVKAFLGRYDVAPSMVPYQVIQKVILPKFESGRFCDYSDEKLVLFTNYVRENLIPYINRMLGQRKSLQSDEEAIADICRILRLKGVYIKDGREVEEYFAPNELCFDSPGRRRRPIFRALEGVEGVPYVSPIYRDRQIASGYTSVPKRGRRQEMVNWDTFFEKLGVWRSPRLKVLEPIDLGWQHKGREWVPRPNTFTQYNRLCEDKVLPDLEPLLEYYHQDRQARHSQVIQFRDLLGEFWEQVYQPENQCRHEWFYYTPYQQTISEASFLHQLRELEWLPVKGIPDRLFRPSQVYFKTPRNEWLLSRGTPFVEIRDDKARVFYQAVGVNEYPDKSEVLGHLKRNRGDWHGDHFPEDWPEQMEAIYQYLLSSNKAEREGQEFQEIVSAFRDEALIFLPTTRGNWWKPGQVFWENRNDVFGDLRGYLGLYYDRGLKRLFEHVGVAVIPAVSDCLRALEDLKTRWLRADIEERRPLKGQVDRIYNEINRLLEMGLDSPTEDNATCDTEEALRGLLDRPLYLNDAEEGQEQFASPADIYYCDDERLRDVATNGVHLLWLQTDWRLYRTFFQRAGIRPLSSIVSVEAVAENSAPAPLDEVQFLRELAQYLRPYLKYRHPQQFIQWDKGEALTKLEDLGVQTTSALRLEYRLKGQSPVVVPNVSAHYDVAANRLYVLSHSNWLLAHLDDVSRELAHILEGIGVDLKTQIESLLSGGFDEEARLSKFKSFDIPQRVARDFIEPFRLRLREGRREASRISEPESYPEEYVLTTTTDVSISPDVKTQQTTTVVVSEELITLDGIQGFKCRTDRQQVVTLPPRPSPTGRERGEPAKENPEEKERIIRKSTVGAVETEARAIEIVIAYEQGCGRKARDVHDVSNLGYDVESTDRYIEVKSFKGQAQLLSLEPSEWEAAERYKDRFYIYVASSLLKGQIPHVRVIRNPYQYLQVYVPGRRVAKNWEPAVSEDIEIVLTDDTHESAEA